MRCRRDRRPRPHLRRPRPIRRRLRNTFSRRRPRSMRFPRDRWRDQRRAQLAELKRHMAALSRASATAAAETSALRPRSTGQRRMRTGAPKWPRWTSCLPIFSAAGPQHRQPPTPKRLQVPLPPERPAAAATATAGTTGSKESSAKSSPSLDEATRARLTEVRTHLTAYAAAKGPEPQLPRVEAQPAPRQPSSGSTPSASSASSTTGMSASTEQGAAGTQGSTGSQSGATSAPASAT